MLKILQLRRAQSNRRLQHEKRLHQAQKLERSSCNENVVKSTIREKCVMEKFFHRNVDGECVKRSIDERNGRERKHVSGVARKPRPTEEVHYSIGSI